MLYNCTYGNMLYVYIAISYCMLIPILIYTLHILSIEGYINYMSHVAGLFCHSLIDCIVNYLLFVDQVMKIKGSIVEFRVMHAYIFGTAICIIRMNLQFGSIYTITL